MGHLEGKDRQQLKYFSLDDYLPEESIVRVIDRFVEVVNIEKLGFVNTEPAETGRPSYPPKELAKLYIYGYENGIRSSRKLERETYRNIEVMWLMNELKPDHKTISNFRKNNIRPIQKLFREFVQMCKSWKLVDGEIIVVDGTKIRASNNKKTNFSRKKLDDRLERITTQINQYLTEMEANDSTEKDEKKDIKQLLENLSTRKEQYEGYLNKLDQTGENELSEVDPDARLMGNNRGGVDVCYNVQSAVDGKHDIVVDYDVSLNPSDQGQLSNMVKKVKKQLKIRHFTVIADKGYYNGEDLVRCKKLKVKTIVSRQKSSDPKEQPKEYHTDQFRYSEEDDQFTCPDEKILYPHSKKTAKRRNFFNKTACKDCQNVDKCAIGGASYRRVTRSQYSDIYAEVDKFTKDNMALYKRRQMIVEHPFGTIKFTQGGYYFLLRTRRKVRSEVALLFLGYNLKRVYNILGFKGIMERLNSYISTSKTNIFIFWRFWCKSANLHCKFA